MAIVNQFYNASTRKYIALFGSIFNKILIEREHSDGTKIQSFTVPISYGPWQKFLSRLKQDSKLDRKSAITLPRMSFEINSLAYDGTRKLASNHKLPISVDSDSGSKSHIWAGAPYDLDISLYVMTKYSEDAVKIVEQILPFFKPEHTSTVRMIEGLEPLDIPLILNSVSPEELYEGDYETRASVMWTLNFTMKCWYFGPTREAKVIKFMDIHVATKTESNSLPEEKIQIQPGLTADGNPTTDINETIPYPEIEEDDDWGIINEIIVEQYDE